MQRYQYYHHLPPTSVDVYNPTPSTWVGMIRTIIFNIFVAVIGIFTLYFTFYITVCFVADAHNIVEGKETNILASALSPITAFVKNVLVITYNITVNIAYAAGTALANFSQLASDPEHINPKLKTAL